MTSTRRRSWSLALTLTLAVVCLAAACGDAPSTATPAPSRSPVAYGAQSDPKAALRVYLDSWVQQFYVTHPAMDLTASDWQTGKYAVLVRRITPLSSPSDQQMAYRVNFQFMVGNAPSPTGAASTTFTSSSTYQLVWDTQRDSWAITLTSPPPDSMLAK
jgi:hypothetical protein